MDNKKIDNQSVNGEKKKPSLKKLAIIAGVIAVVILVAVGVDYLVRNPPCTDELAANNVMLSKVLPAVKELSETDPFSLEFDRVTIERRDYIVVRLFNEADQELGTYFIRTLNSRVYVKDAQGKLVNFLP